MWVLLQFISGSIQKNALADFLPVMKLFDLLYPEKEVCITVANVIIDTNFVFVFIAHRTVGYNKGRVGDTFPTLPP